MVELVEVYGEYVSPFDLLISTVLSLVLGFISYIVSLKFIIPSNVSLAVTIGLIGASLGFIVTLLLIKPKRVVMEG